MEETQIVPNTGELEEEHLYSEFTTGDGKQGRDSGQQHSLWLWWGTTNSPSQKETWSVLCRKGFCRWEAAQDCGGVGDVFCCLLHMTHWAALHSYFQIMYLQGRPPLANNPDNWGEKTMHLSYPECWSSKCFLSFICRNGTVMAVLLDLEQNFHLKIAWQITTVGSLLS